MGRAPCCDKANVKRGPWSPEEDAKLRDYIHSYGTGGNWIALPQKAGLKRCGKSCRLRWLNYLRPNIKHGDFSDEEDRIICSLYASIGSRWSIIAAQLPGRTDNDIKNYWNTKLKKKLMGMSNNINLNPPLMLSHNPALALHNTPSPDSNQFQQLHSPALPSPPFNSGLNYYNAPLSSYLPLTEFDQANNLLVNSPTALTTSPSTFPQQDGGYLCSFSPMQSNYQVFGGAQEPSCSSSDGSYNNNNNNQYDHHDLMMGYGLEEIKQLISTNTVTSGIETSQIGECSKINSFYFDENNSGERVTMYY